MNDNEKCFPLKNLPIIQIFSLNFQTSIYAAKSNYKTKVAYFITKTINTQITFPLQYENLKNVYLNFLWINIPDKN